MAKRVLTALGSDPTQGFVMLNRSGTPIWASDSVFSLVDFAANAADPFLDALHPDDVELCSEIFGVEREGVADTTFGMDRRFELIVRIRSPRGGWRPVALRLLNLVHNPEVDGMLLQLTLANQEHSTVEAFDAAALGEPLDEVLKSVLETLCSGGSADVQAAVFDEHERCIAATRGSGIALGELRMEAPGSQSSGLDWISQSRSSRHQAAAVSACWRPIPTSQTSGPSPGSSRVGSPDGSACLSKLSEHAKNFGVRPTATR